MFDGVVISDVLTWFVIPNLIATGFVTFNKAFYANIVYCVGYLCMYYHNYSINDPSQIFYFIVMEFSAICGVIYYCYKVRKCKV